MLTLWNTLCAVHYASSSQVFNLPKRMLIFYVTYFRVTEKRYTIKNVLSPRGPMPKIAALGQRFESDPGIKYCSRHVLSLRFSLRLVKIQAF